MYQLVFCGLVVLSIIAVLLGFFGQIAFGGFTLLVSLIIVIATCYLSNRAFAAILNAPYNLESSFISGLILFFIVEPSLDIRGILILIIASVLAMLSKYLFAINKKHIFNPVAFSAFILGLFGIGSMIWWVATPVLTIFCVILGFLIVRKIRRFQMVLVFLIVALCSLYFVFSFPNNEGTFFLEILSSWPLIFFTTIMFTEPLTTPPTKKTQMIYAVLTALLFSSQIHIGPLFSTPEFALVAGNIFSYFVSSKQRLLLKLKSKTKLSPNIFDFTFTADQKLKFQPGQYLEWTLPHNNADNRGYRRFFTVASSPTEDEIKLGVRIDPKRSSSFKKELQELQNGGQLSAKQLSGEFVMPKDQNKKMVFIAGGIGITPFRSMIKFLVDKNQKRDIVLIYSSAEEGDFVYRELFDGAGVGIGLKPLYIVTNPSPVWTGYKGYVNKEMVEKEISDFKDRTFYLSGPNAMVENYKKMLLGMGIKRGNIKTDYFPGF